MRKLLTITAAAGALAFAGCGDDENGGNGGSSGGGGGGGGGGGEVAVTIKDTKFEPHDVTVTVGQTVKWTNEDGIPHNVIGGPLKSENLNKGDTYTFTANEAGTIDYECTIHPGQTGKLIVE